MSLYGYGYGCCYGGAVAVSMQQGYQDIALSNFTKHIIVIIDFTLITLVISKNCTIIDWQFYNSLTKKRLFKG